MCESITGRNGSYLPESIQINLKAVNEILMQAELITNQAASIFDALVAIDDPSHRENIAHAAATWARTEADHFAKQRIKPRE